MADFGSKSFPEIKVGDEIGSGIVTSFLGEGGSAAVYRIRNDKLAISRAVKILKPDLNEAAKQRFDNEMKILAQLSHPNIINVHSVGEYRGLAFIEMDLADGIGLDELILRSGGIPLIVVLAIIIEAGNALYYIHSRRYIINKELKKGILHRDVKPANILLPYMNRVRLTDFGISTFSTQAARSLTAQNTILGSMRYIAPEELEDKPVNVRNDIYSFGCVMYEMITGNKAFWQSTMEELVAARVRNSFKPIESYRLKIPTKIVKLIKRCMSVNPERRPESVWEIVAAAEKIYKKKTNALPEETIAAYLNGIAKNTERARF